MGYSEIVNHEHISLLPAIEHQVLPHCVPHMVELSFRDLDAVTIAGVESHLLRAPESEQNDLEQPSEPAEQPILETTKTFMDVYKITRNIGSVEHL